jgi:hypothetical protein
MDNSKKDNSIIQKFIQKTFLMLNNDETKKHIQVYIIDPLLNHIIERIFPYIILTTVLFIILILCIVSLFVFIYIKQMRNLDISII